MRLPKLKRLSDSASIRRILGGVVATALAAAAACLDVAALQGGSETPPDSSSCDACGDVLVGDVGAGMDGGSECPAGQVRGDGGACVAVCAGNTCNPHMKCGADGLTCECVVGYTKSGSGACEWTGGPKDPGFMAAPPVWEFPLDGGMTYAPTEDGGGLVDPGELSFGALCGAGYIRQTFPMPSVADGDPFALELSTRCASCGSVGTYPNEYVSDLVIANRRITLPKSSAYGLQRMCLGERAYGGDVTLSFVRGCGYFHFDHVGIVPSSSCPLPGKMTGGDFETPGTWSVSGPGAEVITSGASTVGHLSSTSVCSDPSLVGAVVSVPLAGKPALTFTHNGRGPLQLGLGPTIVAEVVGSSVPSLGRVCLPDWARGLAWPITLVIPKKGDSGCMARDADFQIDNIQMVEDAECPAPGYVMDPGFEGTPSGATYHWTETIQNGSAGVTVQTTDVRSGARALRLGVDCGGGQVFASMPISVPETTPSGPGPILRLYTKIPQGLLNTQVSFGLTYRGVPVVGNVSVPSAVGWTLQTQCLPRTMSGRSLLLRIGMQSTDCNASFNVDDVEVTTDSSCP